MAAREPQPGTSDGVRWLPVVVIATAWCVVGGIGHFFYANLDWTVRDSVLLDLARDPWPVTYRIDGALVLLRAPIGYFLPAALLGPVAGVRVAELALLAWTVLGVSLVFALMTRDRPTPKATLIRIGVFVMFSGLDIVGMITHMHEVTLGTHLEWWAFLFQYSSQTTQLFWVPNHALPGWIAMAWLSGTDPRRVPVGAAALFIVFAPLWSPLTAIGIAPVLMIAVARRLFGDDPKAAIRAALDPRLLVVVATCFALVFPYLTLGSAALASGQGDSVPFVGEDFLPRYVEFCVLEFAIVAFLLLKRTPRDVALWTAVAVLLALPFYRFGPYNDLAMRASIAPLALLAIESGRWLGTPGLDRREAGSVVLLVAVLAVGAVTPFMEFARAFIEPPWPMNVNKPLIDATRGDHYLTGFDHPWSNRFMRQDAPPSTTR